MLKIMEEPQSPPLPEVSFIDVPLPPENPADKSIAKPTFKSALQAKKRLQAFSTSRPNSGTSSPKKVKNDEKTTPKKVPYHDDKAKAVIEEIEEIKREELAILQKSLRRSRSSDRGRFRRVEKKSRNYRRRRSNSITEEKPRKSPKHVKKYPKNWQEFNQLNDGFEVNRRFNITPPTGNYNFIKQLIFNEPSTIIVPFKMKNYSMEEKIVPVQFMRYTASKPTLSYSINFNAIKESYLSRKVVLQSVPTQIADNLKELFDRTSTNLTNQRPMKNRRWYRKFWDEVEEEPEENCTILEKSVGLSFLQSYEEVPEVKIKKTKDVKKKKKKEKDKILVSKKKKQRKKSKVEKKKPKEKKKRTKRTKEQVEEELRQIEEKLAKRREEKERRIRKRKHMENDDMFSKKKKKKKKSDDDIMKTPDTEEYHSHWESDENIAPIPPRQQVLKVNRSWESDEELFDRRQQSIKKDTESYANLEIPLNITTNFSRRYNNEAEEVTVEEVDVPIKINVIEELKLLEEERRSLSEERKKLELEKLKILKLQEEVAPKEEVVTTTPEVKNELQTSIDSNCVLENEYEEFMKAVTKKDDSSSSSSSSSTSSWSSDQEKKKKRKIKKKKKKKIDGLLLGKNNEIFNEFDIPVPSDLPDLLHPIPVPEPIPPPIEIPSLTTPLLPIIDIQTPDDQSEKPFIFSSIILSTKKTNLLDNSNLKLDDDSSSPAEQVKIDEAPPLVPSPDKAAPIKLQQEDIPTKPPPPSPSPRKLTRRSRSQSRDHRRRYPSPRRRTNWRHSPSPRRRFSPLRRRRRSPSISPNHYHNHHYHRRPADMSRKRTPSPIKKRPFSPLNSPLDGFKKSVADSTISDDMLPPPSKEYSESPPVRLTKTPELSPKRLSLDDRINQVLGLEKEEELRVPPPSYNFPPFQQFQYPPPTTTQFPPMIYTQPPPPIPKPIVPPTQVLQVGNILQVVPNENLNSVGETTNIDRNQKILQVGNMLQIVPAVLSNKLTEIPPPPPPLPPPAKPQVEEVSKQKMMAEREKRHLERDKRRKEKEVKRKEKDKRKQMKLKIKAENMIKRAIQLETEAMANDEIDIDASSISVIVSTPPPTTKSILLTAGSAKLRKSVQFADGIRPGEGTSPSGGEELSSPPPQPRRKHDPRFKKAPIKKRKKKIRVKVVRKRVREDDEEEDDLPPPPPPPGSPPPHIFPSRVKTHTVNNIHPFVVSGGGFPFRPPLPVVINRHQPPPGYFPPGVPTHH